MLRKSMTQSTRPDSSPKAESSAPRWLSAEENKFGVDLLDCRPLALGTLATTGDPEVALRFVQLRGSDGSELRGVSPPGARTIVCNLVYPQAELAREGPLYKAEEMEDKWDIYSYDRYVYFLRSWTGELVFRATVSLSDTTRLVAIETAPQEGDDFVVQQVDFLVKSHVMGLEVPHPLPQSFGKDAKKQAAYSFSAYGRRGLYGCLSNTLSLRPTPGQ
jgi:hypothetical protein